MKKLTPYHRCPVCGKDRYGPFNYLAVYPSADQEKEMIEDGITRIQYKFIAKKFPEHNGCCDFGPKHESREAAETALNKYLHMEDVYLDFYEPYDPSYDDDYGPVDSDPYDVDRPYF